MKSNKIFAAAFAAISFYLLGIVINSIFLLCVFNVDATQTHIWSGYGFLALFIAGFMGIVCTKIYKYFSSPES